MTPDTTAYLGLALVVAFGTMGLYAISLIVRLRNLAKQQG